jgi:hypothetical protein
MTGHATLRCFNRGANNLMMFRRSQRIHFTCSARGYHGANLMFKKLRQIVSQAINIERQIALERVIRKAITPASLWRSSAGSIGYFRRTSVCRFCHKAVAFDIGCDKLRFADIASR